MEGDKKKLEGIAAHVHNALRALKMGETGTIGVTRDYPADDLMEYVKAYAMHKRKWFRLKLDRATNTLYAERVAPAPWPKEKTTPEHEEP